MRAFLEWHATWWKEKAQQPRNDITQGFAEGMMAYARRQARIRWDIQRSFDILWEGSEELAATGIGADNDILDLDLATSQNPLILLPVAGNDSTILNI